MGRWRLVGIVGVVALGAAACAEPPVKPIPDATRNSVTVISADISGVKQSDTSKIAARGSEEAASRGAAQGAAAVVRPGMPLGLSLLLMPIGAAVGSVTGAAEVQPDLVVDEARANLRIAVQETDFGELLRSRLAQSTAGGQIEIAGVTSGSSTAPLQNANGKPVNHVLALEYRVAIAHRHQVNPQIGINAMVMAQVQSPDRKDLIHQATWHYCSPRRDFVLMGANQAAALRGEIDTAAAILAEAIPYDLYVSKHPRPLKTKDCMDFSDLPSGRGRKPPSS